MKSRALIGYSGFVGGTLLRQRGFDSLFNSTNIYEIGGRSFGRIVCAAAPAIMWAANRDPAGDAANLDRLAASVEQAEADELVLISTIAVFDDISGGYTESRARYESVKAYGRNRRALEERLAAHFRNCHILRLPALFGAGLRKNFIFDLLNPIPSFIAPDRFEVLEAAMDSDDRTILRRWFAWNAELAMWAIDRPGIDASGEARALGDALLKAGFVARDFTNSASRYQFYDMERLGDDIDRAVAAGLPALNICSEPLEARTIHRALVGDDWNNDAPVRVEEDVRTDHAAVFGSEGPYLYSADATLAALTDFYRREARR